MADNSASGSLTAAWDGVTPAAPPAGSIVLLAPGRDSIVGVDVRGTFSATVLLEVSLDGLNWAAPAVTTLTGAGASATVTTAGTRLVSVSGAALLRARCSAYTSGTAVVVMAGTPGGGGAGGSGGGGASTLADGADVAEGTTTDAGIITDTSGTVIGFLRGAIKMWITFLGRFPAALGSTTAANSLPVTLASDGTYATLNGAVTETAPATDTASSGLNGRLQRIAQRLTSLIALLPASLGSKTAAASLGVALATDEPLIGALTETAPATDTASSGLNGRLQRVAQRLTSLLALFPGAGASADGTANPTVSQIEVFPMVWNGTTWDRVKDMAAAQALTGFTGVPAMAPFYLDTTGTPSVRRAVTAASTTSGVTGTQVPAASAMIWDGTNFRPWAGDTSGRGVIMGAAAAGAAVAGNPVLLGVSDGTNAQIVKQVGDVATAQTVTGIPTAALMVRAASNDMRVAGSATLVGDGNSFNNSVAVGPDDFNGTNWDRHRNNVDVTLLASAARTTTQTSADITAYNCQAIVVTLDVTATVSTVSLTVVIRYKDPASGKYIALLTGTTVAASGTTTYCVDPRLTAGTPPYTKTVPGNLGRVIQIEITVGNANSQTYSVGYTLIPG